MDLDSTLQKRASANNQIYNRSMQGNNYNSSGYADTVTKRIMERDIMFNSDSRVDKYKDRINNAYGSGFANDPNIGEITGSSINFSEIDQGMPLRFFSNKDQTNTINAYNPSLDFELYEGGVNKTNNVSYHDPYQTSVIANNSFSDFTETEMHQQVDKEFSFSELLNRLAIKLFYMFNYTESERRAVIASPFSLLSLIGTLYRGSNSSTEKELRYFFSFPDKQTTFDSFKKYHNSFKNSSAIKILNVILFPSRLPLSKSYLDYVNNCSYIDSIDTTKPQHEIQRINYALSASLLDATIVKRNSSIILVSSISFYSRWKYAFANLKAPEIFFSKTKRQIQYMVQNNMTYNYTEDTTNQLIEIEYKDGQFAFGILLSKVDSDPYVSYEQLSYYISKLQKTDVNVLKIPKFKHQSKFRVDNTFKNFGVKELFKSADLSDITPTNEVLHVSAYLHQVSLTVNEVGTHVAQNKNKTTNLKFIANHPFIYYIRSVTDGTIIIVGTYI